MSMEFTGERMVPGAADPATFWHHVYRYRFALPYVQGRVALDVACGEGYGAASFRAAGATRSIGVDLSEDAVRHARVRYGIEAIAAPGEAVPLPDGCLDTLVSFETIEHVPEPAAFLRECARLLRPGGTLVISSPQRELYRKRNGLNAFHCSELSESEFLAAVGQQFDVVGRYGQYPELQPAGLLNPRLWRFLPWLQLRGFNRLRRLAMSTIGRFFLRVTPGLGDDPARTVLGRLPGWNSAINPNLLRPRIPSPHLDFVFLLLVARRR